MIYPRTTAMKQPQLLKLPRMTTPMNQRNLASTPGPNNLCLTHHTISITRLLFSSSMVSNLTHHTVSAIARTVIIIKYLQSLHPYSFHRCLPSRPCRYKEINLSPFVTPITLVAERIQTCHEVEFSLCYSIGMCKLYCCFRLMGSKTT